MKYRLFRPAFVVLAIVSTISTSSAYQPVSQLNGPTLAVELDEPYAFVGAGASLFILENPTYPVIRGRLSLPGVINGMTLWDDFLYVAAEYAGLRIINVTDVSHPIEVASFSIEGVEFFDVSVSGSFAFIAAGEDGVYVIDVQDPYHPEYLGTAAAEGISNGVASSGPYGYVSCIDGGLRIVEAPFTPDTLPEETGSYGGTTDFYDVAYSGGYAVLSRSSGLAIVNVANPFAPTLKSNLNLTWGIMNGAVSFNGIAAKGRYVYATSYPGLWVIDIWNPSSPVCTGILDESFHAFDIAVDETLAVLAVNENGILITNLDPQFPTLLDSFDAAEFSTAMTTTIAGNLMFVSDPPYLHSFDISDPTKPVRRRSLYVRKDASAIDMVAVDGYLYVSILSGLNIYSYTQSGLLTLRSSHAAPSAVRGLDVSGDYAYLAVGFDGLAIVDVSDKTNPRGVGFHLTPNWASDVRVIDSVAYVLEKNGLRVFHVSNPESPQLLGGVTAQCDANYRRLDILDHRAYVANIGCGPGLTVFDVSNPAFPIEKFGLDSGRAYDVSIRADNVYLAAGENGLKVAHVNSRGEVIALAEHDGPGLVYDVDTSGNYLAAAAREGGVLLFRLYPTPLFSDGFELGNASAWSQSTPQ